MKFATIAVLLCFACALACSSMKDLQALQAGLQKRFHLPPPGIELRNDTVIVIGIEDSMLIGTDSLDRSQVVDSIARFVRDSFPGFRTLSVVTIGLTQVSHSGGSVVRTPYFVRSFHTPALTRIPLVFQ